MLILSRAKNESIVINGDITVTVVEIRGDKVRLGIALPKDVPIHRREVFEAIRGDSIPPLLPPWSPPVPRTPEEAPFLQAIAEQPEDDANRLVFADWLEERGDPLAEYFRNQFSMSQLKYRDAQWCQLEARQQSLWSEHRKDWAGLASILRTGW